MPSSELSSFTRVQAASHHARPASIVRLYAAFLACRSLIWSALDGPKNRHFQPRSQQLLPCSEKIRWAAVRTGMRLTANPDRLAATRLSPLHPLKGVGCSASTNSCHFARQTQSSYRARSTDQPRNGMAISNASAERVVKMAWHLACDWHGPKVASVCYMPSSAVPCLSRD